MLPIHDYVDALERQFEVDDSIEAVHAFNVARPIDPSSLDPYLGWRDVRYTRQLVHRTDRFEVMVLCWDRGQISAIHNHCDQKCWMMVPIGRLLVQNYRVVEGGERERHCKLAPTDAFWMGPEAPGIVELTVPIHSVGNPIEAGERAASVHVYSLPYDTCMVYSLEDDTARSVDLCYDNVPQDAA